MAVPKPTPEEKLFAVIQGAKAAPLRGSESQKSWNRRLRQFWVMLARIDLPLINRCLMGLILLLGAGLVVQFFTRPSVDRLIARAETPAPFHLAPPLEKLKPLEEYLPKALEQDPFRVGRAVPQTSASPSQPEAAQKPDPKALIAKMRLVGISWGDSPTAMIEQDKQTYFLKPGDAIGTLTVKAIERDHVVLKADDQEMDLF